MRIRRRRPSWSPTRRRSKSREGRQRPGLAVHHHLNGILTSPSPHHPLPHRTTTPPTRHPNTRPSPHPGHCAIASCSSQCPTTPPASPSPRLPARLELLRPHRSRRRSKRSVLECTISILGIRLRTPWNISMSRRADCGSASSV